MVHQSTGFVAWQTILFAPFHHGISWSTGNTVVHFWTTDEGEFFENTFKIKMFESYERFGPATLRTGPATRRPFFQVPSLFHHRPIWRGCAWSTFRIWWKFTLARLLNYLHGYWNIWSFLVKYLYLWQRGTGPFDVLWAYVLNLFWTWITIWINMNDILFGWCWGLMCLWHRHCWMELLFTLRFWLQRLPVNFVSTMLDCCVQRVLMKIFQQTYKCHHLSSFRPCPCFKWQTRSLPLWIFCQDFRSNARSRLINSALEA